MMVNIASATALFAAALLPAASAQQTIIVGGSDGWVVKPGNAPYDDIVANVGDTLQFSYSSWYHDVVLVDNENCDFTNGQTVDDTGDFAWTIEEPGTYIFACSRGDHCSSGNQQVTVRVGGGSGETIVVGGSDGWVVKAGNALYDEITANVGDTLQFNYEPGHHDVMLVDNENCDFTNGQMVDESGSFSWTITEPGTYTFACTIGDHCSYGNQQVTVRVDGGDGSQVDCVGDVTGDLLVDVNDLLGLLGVFGQTGDLAADITNDLVVDVNDLLALLGEFGNSC